MRIGGDDPIANPVLEPRHDREHDDQRGHAEKDAAHSDPYEQRKVRATAARRQVPQAEEQLERQPTLHSASAAGDCVPPSGRRWGNRITSRIDGELAKSIVRRPMPIPTPAAGGMPYSSART